MEETTVALTPQQEDAVQKAEKWLERFEEDKSKQIFVLAGYAGTGKSFATREIVRRLKRTASYMAYTGKAALVISKYNQVHATTIHSRIYKPVIVSDDVFKDLIARRDELEVGTPERLEIMDEIKRLMTPEFTLNSEAFEEDDTDLLVLDECSMVDDVLLEDLKSFGLPILALGDPGQLPPIAGTGALFRGAPDAMLTDIRRQALGSPIIDWSMKARTRTPWPSTSIETILTDKVAKVPRTYVKPDLMRELFAAHDVVLCWKNITRMHLNSWNRKRLGYTETSSVYPTAGERIIFTKNDKEASIFNGLFADVVEVGDLLDLVIELFVRYETDPPNATPRKVRVLRACFDEYVQPGAIESLKPWDYKGNQLADFGYVLTCHKAQGSQWDNVLIFEENVLNWDKVRDERAKWLYTAITRAAEKVTILTGDLGIGKR